MRFPLVGVGLLVFLFFTLGRYRDREKPPTPTAVAQFLWDGCEFFSISRSLPIHGYVGGKLVIENGDTSPMPVMRNFIAADYFKIFGLKLLVGRNFTADDRGGSRPVVIINEHMARTLWANENPIGKRVANADLNRREWQEIIGVVKDVRPFAGAGFVVEPTFQVFGPLAQSIGPSLAVALRTTTAPNSAAAALRLKVAEIDPDQALHRVSSAERDLAALATGFGTINGVLTAVATLAILLSATGLYGVIANTARQRTFEIAVRIALGAKRRDVLRLILGESLGLVVVGLLLGLFGAWVFAQLLKGFMDQIVVTNRADVAFGAILLTVVALIASWLPARRATKVNPMMALRAE